MLIKAYYFSPTPHNRVQSLEDTVSSQRQQLDLVESLAQQMDAIFVELDHLRKQAVALGWGGKAPPLDTHPSPTGGSGSKEDRETQVHRRNKQILSQMTKAEVCLMHYRDAAFIVEI